MFCKVISWRHIYIISETPTRGGSDWGSQHLRAYIGSKTQPIILADLLLI